MTAQAYNVLFLCTGNSARSVVERMMAFRQALRALENRIEIFMSLPLASLDRLKLQKALNDIGRGNA